MSIGRTIKIRRGYNIPLIGQADKQIETLPISSTVSVKPDDFKALQPKLLVQAGDVVKAGQALFFDKDRPDIKIPSPVSGEVAEIVRGEKRRILEVRILADKQNTQYLDFGKGDAAAMGREAVIQRMLESGVWAYLRQRPYSLIADPAVTPKAIFVSCFDSAPLAPDMGYVLEQDKEGFLAGIEVLRVLSGDKLHLGVDGRQDASWFSQAKGVQVHTFSGPHPAGNVGIQIHHIDPIQAGEAVWYANAQDVCVIGRLFSEGRYRADRIVALAGSCVQSPRYFKVITGQEMSSILEGNVTDDHSRKIQGNVLTGTASSPADHLSFYTNQVTVIPEGDQPEFFGWALPGLHKLSLSRSYFSWLMPKKKYALDTNMHGEKRAFVVTGQYDQVLPMNIFPVYLLKSILARDVERMEQLGIYEISEEDFALCEFVCTSKIDVQQIVAEGLEYMRTEA